MHSPDGQRSSCRCWPAVSQVARSPDGQRSSACRPVESRAVHSPDGQRLSSRLVGWRSRRRRIRRTASVHRARLVGWRSRRWCIRRTTSVHRARPVGRWSRRRSIRRTASVHRARLIGRWSRRRSIHRTASVHRARLVGWWSRRRSIHRTPSVGNRRRPRLHSGCRHLSWWRLLDLGVRCRNVCRTQALYFACSQRLARVLCQLLLLLGKWHRRSRRFCLCHHGTVGNCCWWQSHLISSCGRSSDNTFSGWNHRGSRHHRRSRNLFGVHRDGRSRYWR